MTLHRNWALPTASSFLLLGIWAIFIARKYRRPGFLFLSFSIIAAGALMVPGWLGGEAVYRYGLGVKSLPVVAEGADGHNHSHGSEHDESTMDEAEHQHGTTKNEQSLTEDAHQHSHENKDIPSETEPSKPGVEGSSDGHNHNHGSENNKSGKVDHQETSIEIEQPLKESIHQHEHKGKKTIEPTIDSSAIEPHAHDSNSLEPIASPLDQDNTSEGTPLSSPSELHSLYHTEVQNEEAVNEESHSHDHAHEH
jgi:hypothetical protein